MTTVLLVLLLTYLCVVAQVVVHGCVHNSLFGRRKLWNRRVGTWLSWTQFQSFDGWRAAHMMHHRHTNTERDPHRVDRPLVPYLLTHYSRVARSVWTNWGDYLREVAPVPAILLLAAAAIAAAGGGALGLEWAFLYWFLPVTGGHMVVAWFNYWGHVNLPTDRLRHTRSRYDGAWAIGNLLTFNFFLHAEHHRKPAEFRPRRRPGERYDFAYEGPTRSGVVDDVAPANWRSNHVGASRNPA